MAWNCDNKPMYAAIRCRARSFHLLQKLPRVSQQSLNPLSLGDRFPGEQAVLARVPVSLWRAGFWYAAVHAAAPLAAHRRRTARCAGADFGAATRARQHRPGIADVIAHSWASPFFESLPATVPNGPAAAQGRG